MPTQNGQNRSGSGNPNIIGRMLLLYAAVGALFGAIWMIGEQNPTGVVAAALREVNGGTGLFRSDSFQTTTQGEATGPLALAVAAILAMLGALALVLPVTWLYTYARHKKGYKQSLVHTLVLLPIVVAAVVVLVKHSLALAFSLAGIVAAVRFRNTLDDSKDAAYLFVVTGIGLAAGVQLSVAIVLSVFFNLVVMGLWTLDYGRSPAPLEGTDAQRRMERALQHASRTGTFVARLDEEVLKSLAPEQLEALADRAWRRRKRNNPDLEGAASGDFEALLRVRTTDPGVTRQLIEPVLGNQLRRWRFSGVVHEDDGTHVLEYSAAMRAEGSRDELLEALRRCGETHVLTVELK